MSGSRSHANRRHGDRRTSLQRKFNNSMRHRGRAGTDYSAINPLLKYFLFAFNMLVMVIAAATAALGIYVLAEDGKSLESFVDFIFGPAYLVTLVGCCAFVVAAAGFYGALRENETVLNCYHYLMSFFLLLQLLVLVFFLIFYFKEQWLADIGIYPEDALLEAIEKYRDDADKQDFIDHIQEELNCCGVSNSEYGYLNWNSNMYFNCSPDNPSAERCQVPFSCCVSEEEYVSVNYRCGADALDETIYPDPANIDFIHTRGCLKALKDILNDNIWLVCGVIPGIFIPQMFFICIAKAFLSQIDEQKAKW